MADRLQVDLVAGNADRAAADVNKFVGTVVAADAKVNALQTHAAEVANSTRAAFTSADRQANALIATYSKVGGAIKGALSDNQALIAKNNREFSAGLAAVERQALNLDFTLRKISDATIGTKGVDGLGKAANRAQVEVQKTYRDLRSLESLAAITRDPVVLKAITAEADQASARLDKLQTKLDRVAAGRQAAAARTATTGAADANARGIAGGIGSSLLTGLGVPAELAGSGALDSVLAGISAGTLASFGALAAAGFGLVKISEKLRDDAKKRLENEEAIAVAINKQIIAGQEQLKTFREADALRQRDRQFQSALNSNTDRDSLKAQIAELKKLRDLAPTSDKAGEFDRNVQQLEARLQSVEQARTAAADAAFNQRNEDFKANQKQSVDFDKEIARKRLESINEARQKISDLGKATDSLFNDLFRQQGEGNPFVRVFSDAEQQIEKTRLATSALSKDLQKTALEMVASANSNALFAARADNALNVVNLRFDAASFRNAGAKKDTSADDLANRQFQQFKSELASGLLRNSQNLASIGAGAENSTKLAIFDFRRQLEESGGLFRNPKFLDEERNRLTKQPENQTTNERLDAQLKALRNLGPENDKQRGEIDRRIIALTQGLNPSELSPAQRDTAARARENEAIRVENQERTAEKERADQAEVQKRIDKNIADLLKLAKSDGLTGIIRIINEAEDKANVTLGKRPTERDAKRLTDL